MFTLSISQHFHAVTNNEATEHLEARMNRLEARIDRVEVALDRIEVRLDRLERMMRRWMIFVMVESMGWMALMVYLK
jgi:chaperonin cofactor prefoldin